MFSGKTGIRKQVTRPKIKRSNDQTYPAIKTTQGWRTGQVAFTWTPAPRRKLLRDCQRWCADEFKKDGAPTLQNLQESNLQMSSLKAAAF